MVSSAQAKGGQGQKGWAGTCVLNVRTLQRGCKIWAEGRGVWQRSQSEETKGRKQGSVTCHM